MWIYYIENLRKKKPFPSRAATLALRINFCFPLRARYQKLYIDKRHAS